MSTLRVDNIELNQQGNATISIANSYNVVISSDGIQRLKVDSAGVTVNQTLTSDNVSANIVNTNVLNVTQSVAFNGGSIAGNVGFTGTATFDDTPNFKYNIDYGGAALKVNENLLINPAFLVDQRVSAFGGTVITSKLYSGTDRFIVDCWAPDKGATSFGTLYISRNSVLTANTINTSFYSLNVSVGTADAAFSTTDYYVPIRTFIEATDVNDALGWGTGDANTESEATLSFWFRSNIANTYALVITHSTAGGYYGTTFNVSQPDTWEFKKIIIPKRLQNLGSLKRTGHYIINIGGVSHPGRRVSIANTNMWIQSSNAVVSHVNANNWMANSQTKMYLAAPQFEKGNIANPIFTYKPYEEEFVRCQRYLEVYGAYGNETQNVTIGPLGVVTDPSRLMVPFIFKREKLNNSIDFEWDIYNWDGNTGLRITHAGGTNRDANSAPELISYDDYGAKVVFRTAGGMTAGQIGYVQANGDINNAVTYPWIGFRSDPL